MSDTRKRLFLLDGMALIYRAHFALIQAPIRNSKGVNTSALYGFINTLLAILEKENPTHIGVAFDTSAPTPRHVKFPAYKAQRDEMPEELAAAIPHVKALCRAFHIPVLEIDGFEADDIIGTLVKRAEPEGFESFMVTPDKDFAQLLSKQTFMWKPGRKGSDHEIITLEKLPDIWGVAEPDHIIDLLGLMGDASDQKELVETHSDQALLSKDLATIITDAPVEVTWDDLVLEPRDDEAVKTLFNEFEFRSLTKRLFTERSGPPDQSDGSDATPTLFESFLTIRDVDHTYHLADTPELQQQLFAGLSRQSSFCFDIETTSLDRKDRPQPEIRPFGIVEPRHRSKRAVFRHHAGRRAGRARAPALDGLPCGNPAQLHAGQAGAHRLTRRRTAIRRPV